MKIHHTLQFFFLLLKTQNSFIFAVSYFLFSEALSILLVDGI